MGQVVDLHGQPKAGDNAFAMCGCTKEGTPMNAVVIMGSAPFISCLVCPTCDAEVAVVNGYVGED